jgi:hypothetical protein
VHTDSFCPYQLQRVQHLLPEDHSRCVQRYEWLQLVIVHPDIFCTDEAQFTRDGINNTRKSHILEQANLHEVAEHYFQRSFSVKVWCGVLGN